MRQLQEMLNLNFKKQTSNLYIKEKPDFIKQLFKKKKSKICFCLHMLKKCFYRQIWGSKIKQEVKKKKKRETDTERKTCNQTISGQTYVQEQQHKNRKRMVKEWKRIEIQTINTSFKLSIKINSENKAQVCTLSGSQLAHLADKQWSKLIHKLWWNSCGLDALIMTQKPRTRSL